MLLDFTFVGVDGSVWPFVGHGAVSLTRPLRLAATPTGLGGPPPEHDDDQNVDQAGVTWRAAMYGPNMIGLKVRFGPVVPGPLALQRFLAYRDAIGDGTQVGEFHVAGPRRRTVQKWRRAGELPDPDYKALLNVGLVNEDPIVLRSDESWWRTDPIEKTFAAGDFATASIDNDADENDWPYYEITGPITAPKIGLLGEQVQLPNIAGGQTWKISTDPNEFYIRDHLGVDRTFYGGVALPGRWYVRAPARTRGIPVTITGTGTSGATGVKVVLPQKYRSAV